MNNDSDKPDDDLPAGESADAGEELSLEQLSQAYAEVLKDQRNQSDSRDADDLLNSDADCELDHGFSAADPEMVDAAQEALLDIAAARSRRPSNGTLDPATEDQQDNAGCPIEPETILEAILFVGAPPEIKLTAKKIASVMRDVSPKEIRQCIKRLNKHYSQVDAPYRIETESGSLQLKLVDDPELQRVREQFYGEIRHARLSQSAIEVLSVVAYHQPITRDQIESIRGRPSGAMLSQLVRRQLIEFELNDEKPRQRVYRTSVRFLELFGLDSIEDLPQTSPVADLEELAD